MSYSKKLYGDLSPEELAFDYDRDILPVVEKERVKMRVPVDNKGFDVTNPVQKSTGWRSSDLGLFFSPDASDAERAAVISNLREMSGVNPFEGLSDKDIQSLIPDKSVITGEASSFVDYLAGMANGIKAAQKMRADAARARSVQALPQPGPGTSETKS